MKKLFITIIILIALSTQGSNIANAQCPMCKMSAESNYNSGDDKAIGLNTGILYLLTIPLLVITSIGVFMWKKNRDEKNAMQE